MDLGILVRLSDQWESGGNSSQLDKRVNEYRQGCSCYSLEEINNLGALKWSFHGTEGKKPESTGRE